ncbi:MAG: ATP-dependent DNA helicase RecG [Gammaproteobacteria bacterium]|nr:MAG: ATP-dependent DNA helicase RecG [Gammaproteobacteria bacterium]
MRSSPSERHAGIPASLDALRGVGPALAHKLARLNVTRPEHLLFLLPQRYEDRTQLTPLGALRPGQSAVVEGEVLLSEVVYRRRRSLLCRISDDTGQLTLRFFYFSRNQQQSLARGQRLRCYGQVRSGPGGLEMVHPEYRRLRPERAEPLPDRLTPVYPGTEGLGQARIRALVHQALDRYLPRLADYLEPDWCRDNGLPSLGEALDYLHRPPPGADLALLATGMHPCQRRLALEEMLAHHLSLRQLRAAATREPALPLPLDPALRDRFLASLGFELTAGQQAALADIDRDLALPQPMMRLVQGDVGCGKTVVAAAAALNAVAAGCQVAVMAPTELLAEQHRESFFRWLDPLGIRVAWLSGSQRRKAREQSLAEIAGGQAQVVVGTHALFQDGVDYARLALVIVDEQHRFGVHQRLRLMDKGPDGQRPHQLVMTATPIPRTLAMTLYADLDTSSIRELPPGRRPVRTVAIAEDRRGEVIDRVRAACRAGRRAYWVCPLIESSDALPSQAAEATHAMLGEALAGVPVGLMHGRMKPEEKEQVMQAFARGEISVLVATTVIEVGVDVPEASLMIIENAERMGLSQLHQLRGRVGRGAEESACVLLYRQPLTALARERLDCLRRSNDGFELARKDLELRGPGEVLGTRQTGLAQFRIADLVRDADLAAQVQTLAARLLAEQPQRAEPLMQRWIGGAARFGQV